MEERGPCPVCGAEAGACIGTHPLRFPPLDPYGMEATPVSEGSVRIVITDEARGTGERMTPKQEAEWRKANQPAAAAEDAPDENVKEREAPTENKARKPAETDEKQAPQSANKERKSPAKAKAEQP